MILGDNPAGNGFILMDLILVELSGHAPPPAWGMGGEGGGDENFRKVFAWGSQKF